MDFAFRTDIATINAISDQISEEEIDEFKAKKSLFKKSIRSLVIPKDGIIRGDTLKDNYFPTTHFDGTSYDVFISHSHNNEDEAHILAAWLEKNKGISCFVDSFVWGSADQLLKEIDHKYCVKYKTKKETIYNYQKRNFTTSHVHAILSMSLLETIQRSKYCIFIESKESVPLNSKLKKESLSPWLYEEIKFMKLLQPKKDTKLFEDIQKSFCCRIAHDVSDILEFPFLDVDGLQLFPAINL